MIVFPNAKINLGLFVTARRDDGFHELETVFYPIQWYDALEAIRSDSFKFTTTGLVIEGADTDNLVVKAYKLLQEDFDLPPVHVHLHKNIPMGAGLGGGSADASFMLKLLNSLFDLDLSETTLEGYAGQLGSDCPFFIRNQPVFASGRGDEFEDMDIDLSGYNIFCVYPEIHISTAEAYAGITPAPAEFNLRRLNQESPDAWRDNVRNDFERPLFDRYPTLKQIRDQLYECGADYAAMSGSGSTIYGIFKKRPLLKNRFSGYRTQWV